jgi:hypothetical protein
MSFLKRHCPGFDEFLEFERRESDFVGVNRAALGRPFRKMGGFFGVPGKGLRFPECNSDVGRL